MEGFRKSLIRKLASQRPSIFPFPHGLREKLEGQSLAREFFACVLFFASVTHMAAHEMLCKTGATKGAFQTQRQEGPHYKCAPAEAH